MKLFNAIAWLAIPMTTCLVTAGCQSARPAASDQLQPQDADAVVAVSGMSCPQCSFNIALLMDRDAAIDRSRVDLGEGRVFVDFAPDQALTAEQIQDLVTRAGFTPGAVTYLNEEAD